MRRVTDSQAHDYELSTGKRFYAVGGILGLGPDEPLLLHGGSDETVADAADPDPLFTAAERVEVAEFMLALWTAYRDRALAGGG